MSDAKKEAKRFTLPEGRITNASLFERDIFTNEDGKAGEPFYKIEVAFDPTAVTGEGTIEDDLADLFDQEFGRGAGDAFLDRDKAYISPFLDGNMLARAREEKGKEGDAYRGKLVLRAKTKYNREGADGPGGIAVYGPDCALILPARQGEVYPGCYGCVAVTFDTYKDYPRRGDRGITAYLVAVQKTRDGDKLTKASDHSGLFKPVAGSAPPAGVRRRRAG